MVKQTFGLFALAITCCTPARAPAVYGADGKLYWQVACSEMAYCERIMGQTCKSEGYVLASEHAYVDGATGVRIAQNVSVVRTQGHATVMFRCRLSGPDIETPNERECLDDNSCNNDQRCSFVPGESMGHCKDGARSIQKW